MFIESNYSFARELNAVSLENYQNAEKLYVDISNMCERKVRELDELKLKIWESFSDFVACYNSIHNKPVVIGGRIIKETFTVSPEMLEETCRKSEFASKLYRNYNKLDVKLAVKDGIFNVAMARSQLGAAVFSDDSPLLIPLQIIFLPDVLVGILMQGTIGKKTWNDAVATSKKTTEACEKIHEINAILLKLHDLSEMIVNEMELLFSDYKKYIGRLKEIVNKNTNYKSFDDSEVFVLESSLLLLVVLKKLCETQFIDENIKDNNSLSESETIVLSNLQVAEEKRDKVTTLKDKYLREEESESSPMATSASYDCVEEIKCGSQSLNNVMHELKEGCYRKKVRFFGSNTCFSEFMAFRNTDIFIDLSKDSTISISNTVLIFDNCTFNVLSSPSRSIFTLLNGRLIFRNCKFIGVVFGTDSIKDKYVDYDREEEAKKCFVMSKDQDSPLSTVYVQDCIFEDCCDTFIHLQSGGRAEISDSVIKNTEAIL